MPKKKKRKKEKPEKRTVNKKEQFKSENKILRNLFIGIGIVIAIILLFVFVVHSANNFTYKGVKFTIVKEGNLVLYNTKLPVVVNGTNREYNFYLRNDPRELAKNVAFNGSLELAHNLVIDSTQDFNCDGYGIISVANLVNLYKISGINVVKDDNAKCDVEGKYAYVLLKEGNQTSVEKTGNKCYNININNCEILQGTERFMLEDFIEINKLI